MHYRPLDRLTAEYLEAMLGPTTVGSQSWGETRGVSSSGFSSSRSVSQQETGRSLLTAAEIRQLPFDSALVLTAGGAPILASKLGVPQPSLPVRVWQTAVAHRETSATLAAAALVLLALLPALRPVVQQPPGARPVVAQAPPLPQPVVAQAPPLPQASVFPTSAAPPPTSAPPSPDAPVRPAPATALPWSLWLRDKARGDTPRAHTRYRTEADCLAGLALVDTQAVKVLEQPSSRVLTPVIQREPGKRTWSYTAVGGPVAQAAWCEKEG